VPALAVADELSDRGADVAFAGTPDRIESRLVPRAGYRFSTYRVRGLERRPTPRLAVSLALAATAPAACMRVLRRERPDVVFGAGGYVSGPMLAAAAALRVPAALLEVDSHLGVANRLASPLCRRVFLSFPIDGLGPPRFVVTGRPVPRAVVTATREEGRDRFDLPPDRAVVLVFGGSQGARSINLAAAEAWAAADPSFTVVHVTGERDHDLIAWRAAPHYRVVPFTDDLAHLLAASDLVVARAGGSVWEIAAAGRASVLVPYPHATAAHQAGNAAYLADAGGAIVVPDAELGPDRLRAEVERLLDEPHRLAGMAAAAARLARPEAAGVIATELLELAR
jgi:UDP-N-acetylglucosamine--N-acetylmuramyl-(pentapeptide) pyrophosphoryl-undecaprenol N-acetylglucosamine transferase